ncbi:MAG: homogentisate 1,2-dioxygenase [Pseudomonadota bacterium]
MRLIIAAALAAGLGLPALAQEAAPNCPADAAPLPAELSAWKTPAPLTAGASPTAAAGLKIGQTAAATLQKTPEVTYALRPEKPGGSVSYGGVFAVDVAKAATYTVALSTGAWIDVVRDGKSLSSVAHGRGPACTGVRKMVAFPLEPGRYLIQIAANGEPGLGIMVAERP